MGIELQPGQVAYRCNLVTLGPTDYVDDTPTMVDFAAGHPDNAQSHAIVAALDTALGNGRDGVRFHPGVEYRHLCVVPSAWSDTDCVPPHDLTGQAAVFPSGPASDHINALMQASRAVVGEVATRVQSTATQIWLWGQGVKPALPDFATTFGVAGRLSSAVDLRDRPWHVVRPRGCRRARSQRRLRQRLQRASERVSRQSGGSRPVPAPRGSHRRGPATPDAPTSRPTRWNGGTQRSSARSSPRSTTAGSRTAC